MKYPPRKIGERYCYTLIVQNYPLFRRYANAKLEIYSETHKKRVEKNLSTLHSQLENYFSGLITI